MKYIDSEKLIAEIERMRGINKIAFMAEHIKSEVFHGRAQAINHLFEFITSLQQEQPLTIEKVVEQCKKFGGNPEVIQPEQKCIFGNIPGEDTCSVCSAYCSLRVPKTKVSASTEIATPSGQVEDLTFEEYLRGVFEINNGIENDPDNLVRIHAPELLKLARKQEQQKVDLDKEIDKQIRSTFYDLDGIAIIGTSEYASVEDMEYIARHFYELGQRTKYQQDRAEFAKLKAKEWQSGYDEGYAKGLNERKEK